MLTSLTEVPRLLRLDRVLVKAEKACRLLADPGALRLYRKYHAHTMIPRERFIDILDLARSVDVEGEVVECGTWKGGMIAALAEYLGRHAALFDSFEGLPDAQPIDGPAALAWQRNTESAQYLDNCTADERDAVQAMTLAGADYEIHKGWFERTLPLYAARQPRIAFLHLDGDWYGSIMTCLEHLFRLVPPGGLVVIDDYGLWDGCTRAVHEYLARTGASEDLRRSVSGATFLRKR